MNDAHLDPPVDPHALEIEKSQDEFKSQGAVDRIWGYMDEFIGDEGNDLLEALDDKLLENIATFLDEVYGLRMDEVLAEKVADNAGIPRTDPEDYPGSER